MGPDRERRLLEPAVEARLLPAGQVEHILYQLALAREAGLAVGVQALLVEGGILTPAQLDDLARQLEPGT